MSENKGVATAPAPNKTVRLYHIGGYKSTSNAPRPEVDSYHQYKNPLNQKNFLPNMYNQQYPPHYPHGQLIIYDKKTKCYYKVEDADTDDEDDEDDDEEEDEDEDDEEDEDEETEDEEDDDENEETDEEDYESEEDVKPGEPNRVQQQQKIGEQPKLKSQEEEDDDEEDEETEESEGESEINVQGVKTPDKLDQSQKTVKSLDSVNSDAEKKAAYLKNHAIKGQVKKTVVEDKSLAIIDNAVTKMEKPLPKSKRRPSETSKHSTDSAAGLDVINESAREFVSDSVVAEDKTADEKSNAEGLDQQEEQHKDPTDLVKADEEDSENSEEDTKIGDDLNDSQKSEEAASRKQSLSGEQQEEVASRKQSLSGEQKEEAASRKQSLSGEQKEEAASRKQSLSGEKQEEASSRKQSLSEEQKEGEVDSRTKSLSDEQTDVETASRKPSDMDDELNERDLRATIEGSEVFTEAIEHANGGAVLGEDSKAVKNDKEENNAGMDAPTETKPKKNKSKADLDVAKNAAKSAKKGLKSKSMAPSQDTDKKPKTRKENMSLGNIGSVGGQKESGKAVDTKTILLAGAVGKEEKKNRQAKAEDQKLAESQHIDGANFQTVAGGLDNDKEEKTDSNEALTGKSKSGVVKEPKVKREKTKSKRKGPLVLEEEQLVRPSEAEPEKHQKLAEKESRADLVNEENGLVEVNENENGENKIAEVRESGERLNSKSQTFSIRKSDSLGDIDRKSLGSDETKKRRKKKKSERKEEESAAAGEEKANTEISETVGAAVGEAEKLIPNGMDEEENDRLLKEQYYREKYLKEQRRQERREKRRRERRERRIEMLNEEGAEPRLVYYDFETDKKSSGVFLHNLVERDEEEKSVNNIDVLGGEQKSEKTPRSKKLKNLNDNLNHDTSRSDGSRKHLAKHLKNSHDTKSTASVKDLESSRTDKSERSRFNGYMDPQPDDSFGKHAVESHDSILIQYHKLPQKSTHSTQELLPKRKKEKKEKKGRNRSKSNPKKSKFDRLNTEEFKKLEEQVKHKFPELFNDEKLFLRKKTTALISAKLDHLSPYYQLPVSRPGTGPNATTEALVKSRPNAGQTSPSGMISSLSKLSGNNSNNSGDNPTQSTLKKFYEPCYKRCRCLMHSKQATNDKEFYPSRDYWNDNSTYEQIFGQNFAGSFPNVKNSVASIRDSNQSRILATDVYTDDNNHLTSIKLHCKCGYWKNKETWNSRF